MAGKKKKTYSEAVKVDHNNAHIPAPTKELILEIASGIHCAVAGMATIEIGEEHEPFESLPMNVRGYWIEGAKTAYAIIAVHGGGQVIKIPNIPNAD